MTSDDAIRKIIGSTNASWVDFSDKSSWFQDEGLTLMAIRMEDVRYIKDKANGSAFRVFCLKLDNQGRYYTEGMMETMNNVCPPCNNNCNQGRDCPNRRTK